MKEKKIGNNIIHFETINSTNSYAKQILNKSPVEGTIILADIQTQGRGRKNRKWSSPRGGLWFSIILYPNIPYEKGMLITMAVSISISQAVEEITNIRPIIKWPNDLLIDGKKVCGILTEFDTTGNIKGCVVGVGINVNNYIDCDLKEIATSLSNKYGSKINLKNLLQSILRNFNNNYKKITCQNFQAIRESWFKYSKIIGKKIKVINEEMMVGTVVDIDENGNIILQIKDKKKKISNGDIQFI